MIMLIFILHTSVSYGISDTPEISAGAAILIDSSSEKIIYQKIESEKMYPASTTKILTVNLKQ